MAEPFPLQTILDLMANRAEGAARDLGRLIAAEQDAKARLALLENYRAEYVQRFQDAASRGITPRQWAVYQDFTGKLDEAIAQQKNIVGASGERTRDGQQRWLDQRNKVKAFDALSQKHQDAQRYREEKREQKTSDELATRKHLTDRSDE